MKYMLAEACQNTFILVDCISDAYVEECFLQQVHGWLHKENCDDALILINGQAKGDSFCVEMKVLGQDGMLAEFCGNGARACAAYLFNRYPSYPSISLRTKRGEHPLSKHGANSYSVKVPSAHVEWNKKFISNPEWVKEQFGAQYIEAGEPHLLLQKALDDCELLAIGRELNRQKEIFPFGINVNSWHIMEEGKIHVKTYERGVQRLTRSCGTGSIACATSYRGKGTVGVSTPGGALKITFCGKEVELAGESKITKCVEA